MMVNVTELHNNYIVNMDELNIDHEMAFNVAKSLLYVIQFSLLQMGSSFMLTLSTRRKSYRHYFHTNMAHIFRNWQTMAMQLIEVKQMQSIWVPGPRYLNMMFVDSYEAFIDVDIAKATANYDNNEYYYIFLQTRDIHIPENMRQIFAYCWKHRFMNVIILIQTAKGRLLLYTYFPYTAHSCDNTEPVLVNEFVGENMLNSEIFPQKLNNFHGCALRVAARHAEPILTLSEDHASIGDKKRITFGGIEGRVLNELSRELNFSMNVLTTPHDDLEEHSQQMLNQGFQMLMNRTADIYIGFLHKRVDRNLFTSSTIPHYHARLVVSVLRCGANSTSNSLLILPFQLSTWLACALSCTLGLLFILLIRSRSSAAHASNWIRFVAVSLGQPCDQKLRRHSVRIALITWILYAFVMRNVYYSLLFHFFRNRLYQELPTTLIELQQQEYQMLIFRHTPIPNIPGLQLIEMNDTISTSALVFMEAHPELRLATITVRELLIDYSRRHLKPGLFRILTETIFDQQITIYMQKHSYLVDHLNAHILRLQATGFFDYCLRKEFDADYFKSQHTYQHTVIGLTELSNIFLVLIGLLICSGIIFFLELYHIHLKWVLHQIKQCILYGWYCFVDYLDDE